QWYGLDSGLSSNVRTIAISGTDVYVGGYFTDAGGVADADTIARWDGSDWFAVGSGDSSTTTSIIIVAGTLFAQGNFTDVDGFSINGLAEFDGTNWNRIGFNY